MDSSDQILWIAYPFLGAAFVACGILWKKSVWAKRSTLLLLIELFAFGVAWQISDGGFGINFRFPFFFLHVITENREAVISYHFGWNNLSLFVLLFGIIIFCWHLFESGALHSPKQKSR